jgi:3-oxoacyl-[acyl-carrier-protein] synthase-1/3-oxoacyl-[acyl-carrier-protein] synthase II
LARAAASALAEAAVLPEAVDLVSVHGTGTSFNDAAEAAALGQVFARASSAKPLHVFKTCVGHTLGAAAGLEALAALTAFERGVLPASRSSGSPMPELQGRVLDVNESAHPQHCLKLSTAFGGANAALVLSSRPAARHLRVPRSVYVWAAGRPAFELEPLRVRDQLLVPIERLPRSDRLASLAVAAGAEALRAARAAGFELDRLRTAVVVGSMGATLELDAEFAARVIERGREHAEPRRFPGTSPNAAAGHVAIAFGLGGLSHAVGTGSAAAVEAVEVARDWLAAGDADVALVIAAEQAGPTSRRVFEARGLEPPSSGASALLLGCVPHGPALDSGLLTSLREAAQAAGAAGFAAFPAFGRAAGLPSPEAFGSVRPPE